MVLSAMGSHLSLNLLTFLAAITTQYRKGGAEREVLSCWAADDEVDGLFEGSEEGVNFDKFFAEITASEFHESAAEMEVAGF